jgi:hypothetical protein
MADSIYFKNEKESAIYVNLYVASKIEWKERGIVIEQVTQFPENGNSTFIFHTATKTELAMHVRIPYWTRNATVLVNGKPIGGVLEPSTFAIVKRVWGAGDILQVILPMRLHSQRINDGSEVAIMYGPLVLAGLVNRNETIEFSGDPQDPSRWMRNTGSLGFETLGQTRNVQFRPLFQMVDEVYGIYFKCK